MDPKPHSSSNFPSSGADVSQGSSADEFYNFCSSLDRSRGVEDVTLQQLATAKETFTDLELAYKNFKHEMELVKEEHRREVGKLNAQLESQAKQKHFLEEQVRSCKTEVRKHQDEIMGLKRTLAESEWEKETMSREMASNNAMIDKLRSEREVLEETVASLKDEISMSRIAPSSSSDRISEGDNELMLVRQEAEKWEASFKSALEEREGLEAEMSEVQNRIVDMEANNEKLQRELHFSNKASNMKVSKLEVQVQNLTKQRDHTRNQLDQAREEQRKSKETISFLQRDVIDAQQKADNAREELSLKTKQVEKLENLNRSQESKVEEARQECSRKQAFIDMYSRQRSSFDDDVRAFESSISELETSLQTTKNEKDDAQRELYAQTSTITTLQDSYQKARARNQELEQHVTNLKEGLAQLDSDLRNERSKSFHTESLYNQQRVEVDELTVKLEKATVTISALETDYDLCLQERDDYKGRSSLSERKILELKNLLQKSEEINSELDEKFSTTKGQTWKLEGQLESATKQRKQLKVELDEEKSKVSKLNKDLLATQNRCSEHQRNVEWHKRESASKEKIIEDLKKSLTLAEQRIESFYEEIDKLQCRTEGLEDEKRELQEKTLLAQKMSKEAETDHVLVTDENERMNSEIQSFYKRLSEMQTNYNVCEKEKHDFQQEGMVLQHKVEKLEEELQESVKKISSFELLVQELSSQNRKSEEALAMYKGQSAEQRATCEELRQLGIEREALIEQLRGKVAVLNAESVSHHSELSHCKAMVEDLEQEKMSVQNDLKTKQDEWFRLNATHEATLRKKEQLQYELSAAEKKIANMEGHTRRLQGQGNERDLDVERAKTVGLEKELSSLKMKLQLIESQSELNQKDLHSVLEEIEQAGETILSLRSEIEGISAEKAEQSQRAQCAESKCVGLEHEVSICLRSKEKAIEEVSMMETRIAKYKSQIETLQKQKASVKEQLDAANDDITTQKEEIMCLERKVIEHKKKHEALNGVISQKESLIQELQMNLGNTEIDLNNLRQESISLKVLCKGLKADRREDEETVASCQDKLKVYEQELNSLNETRMILEKDLATAKFKTTSLERQLEAALKDKEHYQSEYHSFQVTVRTAKEETLTIQNHLKDKERKCKAYVADLKQKEDELEKMRSDNVALRSELLEVREELETIRYNFENSQLVVRNLEASLSEANDSISKLDLSIENLHQEKIEMSGNIDKDRVFEVEALLRKSQEKEQSLKEELITLKTKTAETAAKLKSEQQKNIELDQEASTLQRKIRDSDIILERHEREKRNLKEELMLANRTFSELEVKYEYQLRERDSIEKQLQETRERTATNRDKLLQTEQQAIEQRLALEFSQKELEERDNLTSQLRASKTILEEQILSLRESLVESREMCEKMKRVQDRLERDYLDKCSSLAEADTRVQQVTLERDRILTESHSCMSKLSSLEQQVEDVNKEKEQLLLRIDDWKQICSKHRETEENSGERITELETRIGSLTAEISKKDSLVQGLNDENAFMGKEIESLRKSLRRIEEDYNSAMQRKREMDSQCRSVVETHITLSADEHGQLERDASVLKRQMADLEVDYKTSREKEEEIRQNLVVASSEAAKWESQYGAIADQKLKIEREMDSLKKEYASLKERHHKSMCQVEFLQEDVRELSNKISQREALTAQLTKAKISLERELQQKDALLSNWESELLQTQRRLQEVQTLREHEIKVKEGKESLLENFTAEKKALEKDVSTLRQELNVHQASLNVAIRERTDAQKELFEVKKQISQYEFQLKSCKEENDDLSKELLACRHKTWNHDLPHEPSIRETGGNIPSQTCGPQEYSSIRQKDRSLSESIVDHVGREQERTIKLLKAEIHSYQLELRWHKENHNLSNVEAVKSQLEEEKQRYKTELTSQIDALQLDKSQMQMEILALQKKLADMHMSSPARIPSSETSVDKVQYEYQLVSRERDEYSREIAKLRKMLTEKNIEFVETQKKTDDLHCQVSWGAKRIEELERLVQDVEDQGNTVRTDEPPSAQHARVSSLEKEVKTLKDRNSELESYKAQCERKLGELNIEHGIVKQKLEKTERELALTESGKTHKTIPESSFGLVGQGSNATSKDKISYKKDGEWWEEAKSARRERQAQLEELLEEMRCKNESLNDKVSNLQAKLREKQQEQDTRHKEHFERKFMVERLSKEKEFWEKEIDLLKRNLMLVRNDNDKAIADKEDLSTRFQDIQLQMAELKTMLKLVQEENDSLKNELSNLRGGYSAVNLAYESLKTGIQEPKTTGFARHEKERTAELQELLLEKEHLNDVIRSLNAQNSSIAKSYELEQLMKRDVEQKVDILQTTVLDLKLAQGSLTAANDKLKQQLEISIQKAKDLECQNEQLRKEKQMISVQLTELQQKLVEIKADNEILRMAKARAKMECDGRSHRLSSIEAAHRESESRGEELQQNLLAAQTKTSELERELKTTRVKLDSLNASYEASEDLVMSLTEETVQLGRKSSEAYACHDRDLKRCKELECQIDFLEKTLSSQRFQLKEASDERDTLRGRLIETESKNKASCRQLEERVQNLSYENKKHEEMVKSLSGRIKILQDEVTSLREELARRDTSSNKDRLQIEKLEYELKVTTEKSATSLSLCIEKDNLIRKLENDIHGVNIERDAAFREKEVFAREKSEMEKEMRTLRQRISGLENRLVMVAGIEKETIALKEKQFQLEKEYDLMNREKRELEIKLATQRKASEDKTHLIIQLERQVEQMELYKNMNEELSNSREKLIQEKLHHEREARFAREETIQCKTNLEMKKKKLEDDLNALRHKYKELERKYNEMLLAQQKLEEVTEIRMRSETLKRDESIYKLERDIRGLKSENEYYEKEKSKKYDSMDEMQRKIARLETENEYLRKHIFIAVESYDKAEKKLKKIQNTEYEPVITYQIRQAMREASGRNRCESLNSSTASLGFFHSRISSPRLGGSPKMSSTPRPVDRTTEMDETRRRPQRQSSLGRSSSPIAPRKGSSLGINKTNSSKEGRRANSVLFASTSEDVDSVFSSPEPFQRSASKQERSQSTPVSPGVSTAFPFGLNGSFSPRKVKLN